MPELPHLQRAKAEYTRRSLRSAKRKNGSASLPTAAPPHFDLAFQRVGMPRTLVHRVWPSPHLRHVIVCASLRPLSACGPHPETYVCASEDFPCGGVSFGSVASTYDRQGPNVPSPRASHRYLRWPVLLALPSGGAAASAPFDGVKRVVGRCCQEPWPGLGRESRVLLHTGALVP